MTHEEMIAVIQAHKEGKTLQMRRLDCDCKDWVDVLKCVSFNFPEVEYRIKPEPHYRPFKNAEEVMEAIKEHGSWVKLKYTDLYKIISAFKSNMVYLGASQSGNPTDIVFKEYTFADGTPFGKLEDTK